MSKNLFLDSFSHLGTPSKKEEVPPVVEKEEIIEPPKIKNIIYLGKGKTFEDSEAAYKYLIELPETEIQTKYHNTLTKSFFNGNPHGQINSLFKDWKKYKSQVYGKIAEFIDFVKSKKDEYPVYKRYVSFLMQGKKPTDLETFEENMVDLFYFKFWVIFKFYTEKRSV